jgi:hypothetical protein
MWNDTEWFEYMKAHNMEDPYEEKSSASLDAFF